ncbi:MAG TPA: DUF4082 domain-containing protein, partial [Nocardioides sp.]
ATSADLTFTTPADNVPPTISNLQATAVTTGGATITWTTNEAADTLVEYGLTTAYGSSTTVDPALVTGHSQALTGLSANTVYHYRARSRDAVGNTTFSADFTFTTVNDTTPPTISTVQANGISGTGATITWTTDEAADTQVEYGLTTAYGSSTTLNTTLVTSHSQALSGLSAATLYHYRVKSKDAASNLATSGDFTFTTGTDGTPPTISGTQATAITMTGATITWTTDETSDTQVEYGLTTAYGSSTTLNTAMVTSHSQTLSGLSANTLHHYRVKSRDAAGNLATSGDFTFTTAADTAPPVISAVAASAITSTGATIGWTTDEASDSQVEYGTTTAYGSSTTLNGAMVTSHSQALSGLTSGTLYHYRVKSRDAASNLATSSDFTFTTVAAASCPCSVWASSTTPAIASQTDSSPIEVGVKFRANQTGQITGVRFYKGAANTGTHVGKLWTSTGTLLASATFAGETASGWQQVLFPAPVAISANTTYVASYYAPVGRYALDEGYFAAAVTNGPLTALADGTDGPNGVYLYATGGGFPNQTYSSSNYWVDVVFDSVGGSSDTTPPVISGAQATGIGDTGATITWTTDEASDSQVEYGTTTSYGSSTTLDPALVSGHSQPLTGLSASTLYHYRVKSKDAAGNPATSADATFTTAAAATSSIWSSSTTPATANENDPRAIEVGVKFRANVAGTITGIRFYKGSLNTGTHTVSLWSRTGALLGRATVTGETASGWQQMSFATPIAIAANTTYVASYYAPNGRYAVNGAYFTAAVTNGPLTALASGTDGGNAVYRYGGSPVFPNQTFNAENYWVDVVFQAGP